MRGLFVGFYLVLFGVGAAAADASSVRNAISGYIVPNVERFAENSDILVSDIDRLCQTTTAESLADARDGFRFAVQGLGRIHFLRIGPLETDNRRDRLLFWPDRRSIGLKQVQRALATQDRSLLNPGALYAKSVALQGFGALEFLLFGSGSDDLVGTSDGYRCQFALSVARNIASLSQSVAEDWQDPSGFAGIWSEPGPTNDLYRNDKEAIAALVGLISNGLEIIRDQQLKPIAPFGIEKKPYKRALFWRSNQTREMIAASLMGMRDLIQISGLLHGLPQDRQWIAGSVEFEFDNAFKALSELKGSIETIVTAPGISSNLSYLVVVTRSLQNLIGEQTAEALGLPNTFSPLDGD